MGQGARTPRSSSRTRNHPAATLHNAAWNATRRRAGIKLARVDDLKDTLGGGLQAFTVTFEDCQDLLGRRSGRGRTHHSSAELSNLIEAANSVCGTRSRKSPTSVILKHKPSGMRYRKRLISKR